MFRLEARGAVDSTNDEARRLAERGAPDGTLVWAESQRAGRGRRRRAWASPPGNLHMSLVLRPACTVETALQIGFVAGLAIADALASLVPDARRLRLKWPNDVLVDGAKIAGVLMESSVRADHGTLDWLILGLGVNVARYPDDTPYPATSLAAEGGGDVTVVTVLEAVARRFESWRGRWIAESFAPVRAAWLARGAGVGGIVTVRGADGSESRGRFVDLDEGGALILETRPGARRRVVMGEVFPADPLEA